MGVRCGYEIVDPAHQDQRQGGDQGNASGGNHRETEPQAGRHGERRHRRDRSAEKPAEGMDRKGAADTGRGDPRRQDRVVGRMEHAISEPEERRCQQQARIGG